MIVGMGLLDPSLGCSAGRAEIVGEDLVDVACPVEDAEDFDPILSRAVDDHVGAESRDHAEANPFEGRVFG
jgi:hypothetical protein